MEKTINNKMKDLEMNAAPEESLYELLLKKIDFVIDKDYLDFIRNYNGAEGFIGEDNFILFWNIDDVIALNPYYDHVEETKQLLFFGTDGSDLGYAFDKRNGNILGIDILDMDGSEPIEYGGSFDAFLNTLNNETSL